jgi:hypothetical protein
MDRSFQGGSNVQAAGHRSDGFPALKDYGALGDGRPVALLDADGSIDWWCVPNLDSPPLFDRLLDPEQGGRFSAMPKESFTVERRSEIMRFLKELKPKKRLRTRSSSNSDEAARANYLTNFAATRGQKSNVNPGHPR